MAPDRSPSPERILQRTHERQAALNEDDRLAASLRGFGPLGMLSISVILLSGNWMIGGVAAVPAGALLVVAWAWLSRTPWREIGYVRPANWFGILIGGAAAGVLFKLLMKTLVMPLLGADPINRAYHFLAGNRAALPAAIWSMLMAGFAEETVFRGFLFERAEKLLGRSAPARAATVLFTSALFGAAHYADQGLVGVEQALITGLVFGTIFAITRRIFFLMCAHAAFDFTALAIIYLDLESKAAHFILR